MGPWPIDQDKGVVYIGTASPIPEWNATTRPGANRFSDSIIAVDASTGQILWDYQTTPHDLNGYGCTNNPVLGEINGKQTIFAACRNGYLYALDATTGDLVWYYDPPAVRRVNSGNADYVKTGTYESDKPWLNYPSTDPALQCPGVFGAVSSNIALAYDTIYVSTFNRCSRIDVAPVLAIGDSGVPSVSDLETPVGPVNSTLYAIDASTGRVKWSHFFDGFALKGGLTVSGGVLYLPSPDGNLLALDASTGAEVWRRPFGALGLAIPPLVGATAHGNWTLIQVVAGTPLLDFDVEQYSGYLFMFTVPQSVITTTSEAPPPAAIPDFAIYIVIGAAIILLVAAMIFYLRRRR
jgi:alcohol dehydrogenase (cytochrome c)